MESHDEAVAEEGLLLHAVGAGIVLFDALDSTLVRCFPRDPSFGASLEEAFILADRLCLATQVHQLLNRAEFGVVDEGDGVVAHAQHAIDVHAERGRLQAELAEAGDPCLGPLRDAGACKELERGSLLVLTADEAEEAEGVAAVAIDGGGHDLRGGTVAAELGLPVPLKGLELLIERLGDRAERHVLTLGRLLLGLLRQGSEQQLGRQVDLLLLHALVLHVGDRLRVLVQLLHLNLQVAIVLVVELVYLLLDLDRPALRQALQGTKDGRRCIGTSKARQSRNRSRHRDQSNLAHTPLRFGIDQHAHALDGCVQKRACTEGVSKGGESDRDTCLHSPAVSSSSVIVPSFSADRSATSQPCE